MAELENRWGWYSDELKEDWKKSGTTKILCDECDEDYVIPIANLDFDAVTAEVTDEFPHMEVVEGGMDDAYGDSEAMIYIYGRCPVCGKKLLLKSRVPDSDEIEIYEREDCADAISKEELDAELLAEYWRMVL